MARDDFTKHTLDNLAKRVGVRCSNPSCRKLTTGPRNESHLILNIGVGAHITAASPGGPRFDPSLTPKQRQSIENGIWLCQNCAKLVDNDPTRFTVEILRNWKLVAEKAALSEIEGTTKAQVVDLSADVDLLYSKVRIKSERHDYLLKISVTNRGTEPLGPYHVDVEIPARVVHKAENYKLFVASRSTRTAVFFRVTSNDNRGEIYPGDTKVVMTIHYFMDHAIYFNRGDLFEQPVRATLYRRGLRPVTLERRFFEFQIFLEYSCPKTSWRGTLMGKHA